MQSSKERIWEIDALRGICILLMVIYHALYDLYLMFGHGFDITTPLWTFLVNFFAGTFIFLSGISTHLSRSSFRRGLLVFAGGLAVTLVTYIMDPNNFVVFGILHFLGIAMLLAHFLKKTPLLRRPFRTITIAAVILAAGIWMQAFTVTTIWFLPLGLYPDHFATPDYFPLLPWFGVFLLGMLVGNTVYKNKRSVIPPYHMPRPLAWAGWIGKYTLYIYLLHQPVVYGILTLIFGHQ